MKKKSLVFGMLAVLTAAFILISCETPVGDPGAPGEPGGRGEEGAAGTGTTLDNEAELAAFGYTYLTPIHVQPGRSAIVYDFITGTVDVSTSVTVTATNLTFVNGDVSVTVPLATTMNTGALIKAALDPVFTASGIGLTATLVNSGKNLQIKGNGSVVTISGAAVNLDAIFGSGTATTISSPSINGLPDEWTFPVKAYNDNSTAPSQITWGGSYLPVPAGTDVTTLSGTFGDANWTSVFETDGSITFTSATNGAFSAPVRPTIEDNANLRTYGYDFIVEHTTVGRAASSPAAAAATPPSVTAGTTQTATTGDITAGDTIVITYGTKKDYVVLPAKTAGWGSTSSIVDASDLTGLIPTPATGVVITVDGTPKIKFTGPANTNETLKVVNVTASPSATTLFAAADATLTGTGGVNEVEGWGAETDEWEIAIFGGNNSAGAVGATRASVVTVSPVGSSPASGAVAALSDTDDIGNVVDGAFGTLSGGYTHSYASGLVTITAGATGPGTITVGKPTIAAQP